MNKQKGLAPLVIIILIALAVSGYLIYQNQTRPTVVPQPFVQSSPSPIASPAPTGVGETANWKTYTDFYQRYSVKYPPTWIVKKSDGGGMAFLPREDSEIISWLTISDSYDANFTNNYFDQQLDGGVSGKTTLVSRENMDFSGYKAVKQIAKVEGSLDNNSKDIYVTEFFINHPQRFKIYIYNYEGSLREKYQGQINQLISTFKFTQ